MRTPPRPPAKMKNVLVALEFYRGPLFEGIARYAREHHWHLSLDMLANPGNIPWGWNGDGILTMLVRDETPLLRFLAQSDKPVVNVEGRRLGTAYPRVFTDPRCAVALAIAHLRERGFTQFGFYGYENSSRKTAFLQELEAQGFGCTLLHESGASWEAETRRVKAWLKPVRGPLAVFCWTDYAGARFMDMALALGKRIPEDIAVLGMDNETLVCDCTAVRLSSVRTDLHQVGYRGAAELDRLMAGKKATAADQLIPPHEVVARGSTDTLATPSPLVAKALARMKDRGADAHIADVARFCGVSRRGLEKAFTRHLGRSPHDALVQLRVDRAKALLRADQGKIAAIGAESGVRDPKHFTRLFKAATGLSPRDYRKQWREAGGGAV